MAATAYLTLRRPARDQWYDRRRYPLTGCTVVHTAESIMDTLGIDTGAEAVAEFIRDRSDPGSYHDLVDSDTGVYLVDYIHGAYHDGTGSNNWALSLSFACRTTDWVKMGPVRRKAFLRQGALRWVAQQLWRQAHKAPLTRLRRISKAQSEAGESGFIGHGERDPGRRTDPGIVPPNLFPWAEFFVECARALGELMPSHPDAAKDDDFMALFDTAAEFEAAVARAVLNARTGISIIDDRPHVVAAGKQRVPNASVRDVLTLAAWQLSEGSDGFRHRGPIRAAIAGLTGGVAALIVGDLSDEMAQALSSELARRLAE